MIHVIISDNSKWAKCNAYDAFAALDAVLHFAVLCPCLHLHCDIF